MAIWTKELITKALNAGKNIHFVENPKKEQEYYNNKKYALEKKSPIIKELMKEGKLPVDDRILKFMPGYYHILSIEQRSVEFKSETRKIEIGYVLYRKVLSEEYWNKIYQIKLSSLTNKGAEQLFSNFTLYDLIDKTICVQHIKLNKETHSYAVNWFEEESFNQSMLNYEIYESIERQNREREEAEDEIVLQAIDNMGLFDEPDYSVRLEDPGYFEEAQFNEYDFID